MDPSYLLQSKAPNSVPLATPKQLGRDSCQFLVRITHSITSFLPKKKKKCSYGLSSLIPATRSCHHRLLRCCSRTGGSGRNVFQQLLPLYALDGSSERRDGPGPVGTQREVDPRGPWQLIRLSGGIGKDRHTHGLCACVCVNANPWTLSHLLSRGFPSPSDPGLPEART